MDELNPDVPEHWFIIATLMRVMTKRWFDWCYNVTRGELMVYRVEYPVYKPSITYGIF